MAYYRLTQKQRREWRPITTEYYGGYKCFFCKENFNESIDDLSEEWEHFDNKENHNIIENVCPAHKKCNREKKNNPDYQIIAKAQLAVNLKNGTLQKMLEENKRKIKEEKEKSSPKDNEEISSNKQFYKIGMEYLAEKLAGESDILFHESLYNIEHRCFKAVGHCGENAIRRLLKVLCCTEGKYDNWDDAGISRIRKRPKLT